MKEINLASILSTLRREKGLTQEQLAEFAGVSKASVSKWETGQSYPDIELLPQLASYFEISIDDLLGFDPQMGKVEIEALYSRLATDFAAKPFDVVMAECRSFTRKYYSCYPLLLRFAFLYINHAPLAQDPEKISAVFKEALQLCERIRENSTDALLLRATVLCQAVCLLSLGDGKTVLELLGDSPKNEMPDGMLIAQAHQLLGNTEKAEETLQADLLRQVISAFQTLTALLQNSFGTPKAELIYKRAEGLASVFNMQHLHPNSVAVLHALGAQMYQLAGNSKKALELLAKYTDICTHDFFPVELKGDDFFDKLEQWMADNTDAVPRDEATIKESMLRDVVLSPVFEPLAEDPEYRQIVRRFEQFIGGN